MALADYGWDAGFAAAFGEWTGKPDVQPARVLVAFNHNFRVALASGELDAVLSGRVKHHARSRADLPAVGDWVAVRRRADEDRGAIVAVLPRRSRFSRRMAGQVTDEQVVAANVDVVFVVMALDADFSARRLERYLLMARESGASPVVLLTKPDLATDRPAQTAAAVTVAGDVPVHVLNPRGGDALDQLTPYLQPRRTSALLGSSGVGKSTIVNRLVGSELRRTREVRDTDSKGRHTTTHRELIVLPDGALIVDTPGMRELQLWDADEGIRGTFDDVTALAGACHFTDCRHRDEPRCAVKTAVESGALDAERLRSYLALQDELVFLARQQDQRAELEEKRRSKVMGKALKQHLKSKRG